MKLLQTVNKSIFQWKVLLIPFIVAFVCLRLYRIDASVADWHSWRQSDTAAVARNFVKFGPDILHPRFDDFSNIPSGRDNTEGWRMVELPLYQYFSYMLKTILNQFSLETWLRLVNIFASLATCILLGLFIARITNPLEGGVASFVFAVLPFGIFYSRAILPETFAVFWAVLSLYVLSNILFYKNKNTLYIISASIFGAVAILVKPMVVFLLIPFVYILYQRFSISKKLVISLFLYLCILCIPFLLWRKWILQFPEGIPSYIWLLNSNGIRFKGAWFFWLFAERIGKLILGYWGLIPFGIGLLIKPEKKEGRLFRLWIIGALLFLTIFATGNVQHDYYQVFLLPVISVYLAKGFIFLLTNKIFYRIASYLLCVISFLFMLAFSWYYIRTFYWINRPEIVEAGKHADKILPENAIVIAPYNGDTTFLYQTNRRGWPIGFDIDKKIALSATHYVTVSPTDKDLETKELAEKYTVLVRNDKYAIIDLTRPKIHK